MKWKSELDSLNFGRFTQVTNKNLPGEWRKMVLSLESVFATPIQNLTKIKEFPLISSCVSSTLTNWYNANWFITYSTLKFALLECLQDFILRHSQFRGRSDGDCDQDPDPVHPWTRTIGRRASGLLHRSETDLKFLPRKYTLVSWNYERYQKCS